MARLKIVDSGVLYRNPLPGHQAVMAYAPFVLPLSDSELICCFRHGQAMYSADGAVHMLRSSDGGRTWDHEGPIRDCSLEAKPYQYCSGSLTRLRDGSLLLQTQRVDRSDPDRLYVNPVTGGSLPLETVFLRSTDRGRSWSEPVVGQLPQLPPGLEAAAGGPVVELSDGRWLLLFETWNSYDNDQPFRIQSFVLASTDQGQTWGDKRVVADGLESDRCYSHGHLVPLAAGRLFCSLWTANADLTEFYDLHTVASAGPQGDTWQPPQPTGIHGQSSYAAELPGGAIAIVYSQRERTEHPGIRVVLSEDGGRTWDREHESLIWDAYGQEALGVPRTNTYPSSHDAIAYGAPHLAVVSPRELLASFWCTQSADTHARFCRLRVE